LTIVSGANVFAGDTRQAAESDARHAFEAGQVQFVQSLDALMQSGFIGSPDDLAERFAQLEGWGINYVRLTFSDAGQQTYFAERVLPHLARVAQPVTAG
jgi:alkanesulfonate monooxygenase SsuD/methylene tetrahydromethanopterin reductase-like flavin-dependent oxidoreductase (luciferase family)